MDQKDRVFTPTFIANLFLIAGTVFLFLKGKVNAYVGYDGAMHDGTALMLIGLALVCIGIGIWIIVWINKNRFSKIMRILMTALTSLLIVLILIIILMVSRIQGTARVVNYAGLVRGKTQRIIKLEISGQPEDGMIQDIEALVDGLRNGNGELGLVRLDDGAFQSKMQELDDYFAAL